MSPITSHILDTACGCPATGIETSLEFKDNGNWILLGKAASNKDGRLSNLLPDNHKLLAGCYRIKFETGKYFSDKQIEAFYPYVEVVFELSKPSEHYHIPLLLSPFGYSTYRGS